LAHLRVLIDKALTIRGYVLSPLAAPLPPSGRAALWQALH
jgi:hypothetical protein